MSSPLFLPMMILRLLFLLSYFLFVATNCYSSLQPLCHDDESLALSQFNQSFLIDKGASGYTWAYPKTASWKLEEGSDCCTWDGVQCDDKTGHVIGLDLSSSFLYGSISSKSSLFHLVHLEKLNLADNHFNHSQIPSKIGSLSRLTYLDLSRASFVGQIPSEVSALCKLTWLDLSHGKLPWIDLPPGKFTRLDMPQIDLNLLELREPDLNRLLQSLTSLKALHLSYVKISSVIPKMLANLNSIMSLKLIGCELQGEFPSAIFLLPNLQKLHVAYNPYLSGYLPEFNKSSSLNSLYLFNTGFSGKLPGSIANLKSLTLLHIGSCSFTGIIPSSLGNLTNLSTLVLSSNQFSNVSGKTLAWLGGQTKLTFFSLANLNLNGTIPAFLQNLTRLARLNLGENQFTGEIPSWLANLTQLTVLQLGGNKLHGPIPQSIFELNNLGILYLSPNNLSGPVEFEKFLSLKSLYNLQLSGNSLSLLTNTSVNSSFPKFQILGLGSCNLSEFPNFLQQQDELQYLELPANRIHGKIPKWFWNINKETLLYLSLDSNFLTGFDQPRAILPWTNLVYFSLKSNMLQGLISIPPPSIMYYFVSNNSLTGEISPLMCNLTMLQVLDLSHNNLTGKLPECFGNFSGSLLILNLGRNNFHGAIPQMRESKLLMIDLSNNQFQGRVPRSLVDCKMLQILNLGNNYINDVFPSWLEILPNLRVLILRSNGFHGKISKSTKAELTRFPQLRIIDLSNNNFTGKLPSQYFKIWSAMKIVDEEHFRYLGSNATIHLFIQGLQFYDSLSLPFSMSITNKGINMDYSKIPEIFTGIDLSRNKFEGEVPNCIGDLKGLQLLNLSANTLNGHIPPSLGNLRKLESLDLSGNNLSGQIPQQLTELTFLAIFNVSNNHLTGRIPQEKQFGTFDNSSFEGNLGLCGAPLSKTCGNPEVPLSPPPTTSEQDEGSKFPSGYDWIFIVAGYGSGLVIGLVVGHILTTRSHEWFVETFQRKLQKRHMRVRRGHRN